MGNPNPVQKTSGGTKNQAGLIASGQIGPRQLSKKRKPNRQPSRPNPYRNSHDNMPGEKTIRRLFEITYICPLCQGVHETHQYVTLPADDLDDFRAHAVRRIREPELATHIVTTDSELKHLERGDLRELAQATAQGNWSSRES